MLHTLEQNRSFPLIAWGAIAIFSGATLFMAVTLSEEMARLEEERIYLESMVASES